jgi:2-oxoisovalerate dehydrogenase E1 component
MAQAPVKHDLELEKALGQIELIRRFEETLLELFSAGMLSGTTHTCIGQEVCAYGVVDALDRKRDIVFSTHRCHGHFLMYSPNVEGLLAEIMGRSTGICGGRGGSQHLAEHNFYSNGVQGGIVPVATGMALAEKMKGDGAVTVCFIGDGTLGEGAVYEALNMASLWQVPILYVLENNRYAQSTPTAKTTAGDLAARAEAFGIATDRRPADDPVGLKQYVAALVQSIRDKPNPFFQILDTERLAAHSKGDDDRDEEELELIRRSDPLVKLRNRVGADRAPVLHSEAKQKVESARKEVEQAAPATVGVVFEEQPQLVASNFADAFARPTASMPQLVVHNLNAALHDIMRDSSETLLIGEDIVDPYGGAFKVTRGLSSRFPDRVFSSPISESGIVGLGTGLSMRGFKPIVEIMFGDFLTLATDQIVNHLAKFRWMYNHSVETPIVIRTPVGGGRGYGPTHSQSLEKMFCGVPGLVTVSVSRRHDPGELLRRATLEDSRPVLVLEHKTLYGKTLEGKPLAGTAFELHPSEANALYPTGCWIPTGVDAEVTVVAYGAMADIVEAALFQSFEEDEIVCEYLVPAQLSPLNIEPILDSIRRTGRLLVVEEGTEPWGFGAEVLARVGESLRPAPQMARVGARHLPIPNARSAERQVLPDTSRIVAALRDLME